MITIPEELSYSTSQIIVFSLDSITIERLYLGFYTGIAYVKGVRKSPVEYAKPTGCNQ